MLLEFSGCLLAWGKIHSATNELEMFMLKLVVYFEHSSIKS